MPISTASSNSIDRYYTPSGSNNLIWYTGTSPTATTSGQITIYTSSGGSSVITGNGTFIMPILGGYVTGTSTTNTWIRYDTVSELVTPRPIQKINHRKIIATRNYARKALWKSIQLFENFFGINQIKLFLSGESIFVNGRKFDYKLTKNKYTGLIDHTSRPSNYVIPYNLEILNKQGLVLCSGCTFFRDTPIIDQLVAIMLHIQDNEENVLLNMNLSNFKPDFYKDEESIQYLNQLKNKDYSNRRTSQFRTTDSTQIAAAA